jgi:hypothetical protein
MAKLKPWYQVVTRWLARVTTRAASSCAILVVYYFTGKGR